MMLDITRHIEIGKALLAADAAESDMDWKMRQRGLSADFRDRACAEHRRLRAALREAPELLTGSLVALLRAAEEDVRMAEDDAPGDGRAAEYAHDLAKHLEDAGAVLDLLLSEQREAQRETQMEKVA